MKLTLCIILLSFFGAIASDSYSQSARLSLNLKNAIVKDVLEAIESQSDFFFLYSEKIIDVNRRVDIDLRESTIEKILDKVFEGTNVNYSVKGRQIVLSTPEANYLSVEAEQPRSVSGKVTDSSGASLPGVSVIIKGTTQGTITDNNGNYSISNIPANATLQFSFVGMRTQEIAASGKTTINVTLVEETFGIEEVVAIGYGTQRKVDLTGSVSKVSIEEFEKAPVSDALQALQGKVPGMQITSTSGEPGAGKQIRIRGIQSWAGSSEPLYVIDGVIVGGLNNLNPEDVESISILKDAASAAIYGARAANGVVLITTKRGSKTGAPVISFNTYAGVQQYSDLLMDRLNSDQWLELDRESYANAGTQALDQSPYGTQNPVNMNIFKDAGGKLTNTDWLDVVSQTGKVQNYELSINGGNEKSTYFTSASYYKNDGMIINTGADRIGLRFNSDHKISDFLEFGNSINIYSFSSFGAGDNVYYRAIRQNPISRPYLTDENGKILGYDNLRSYTLEGGQVGPLVLANEYSSDSRSYGFMGNIFVKVKLLKGLTFTPRISVDYGSSLGTNFVPELHLSGVEVQSINHVDKNHNTTFHWTADYMLNYENTFNDVHNVSALFVYSQEESKSEYLNGTRYGTPNNQIRYLSAGELENQSVYNGFGDWSFVSYIGRISYNYKEKYLIQGSVRRDGTSRFTGDNRWGVFPSVSAGWRISKEGFFEPVSHVINDFKIRASRGLLGNAAVGGLYPTYATLTRNNAVMGSTNAQYASPSYTLATAVNSELRWEQRLKSDIGFDASLFASKLNLTFDYYFSKTTDMLFNKPLPLSAGKYVGEWDPSDPTINGGEMQNKGVELSLGYRNHDRAFKYNITGYLSLDRNKVTDLEGRELRESGLEVGQPIYGFFGYTANGIVKNQAILNANPYLTSPDNAFPIGLGDIWTVDINGRDEEGNLTGKPDGKITADDRGFIGRKYPDFTYGFSVNLEYKRWSFQMTAYGVQGVDLNTMSDTNGYLQYPYNEPTRILDRWEATKNPDGNMPKVTKADVAGNATRSTSFWLSDASFLKINNVNLNYAVPSSVCQKLKMKDLDIYGSVENLYTFTKYPGGEVDVTDDHMWSQPTTKIPQPRTWVLGLKVTF